MSLSRERPGVGKLKPRDEVWVITRHGYAIRSEVSRVGRIWAIIRPADGLSPGWRMRLDTQTVTGAVYGVGGERFVTLEQRAWDKALAAVNTALVAAGVSIDPASPWSEPDRRELLAEFLADVQAAELREHHGG